MPRRRGLLSPSLFLRNGAIYKGFLGGSRGWMAVGAVIFGRRAVKKAFGKSEETIALETLKAGQFVRIEAIKPPTRRQRKRAEQAERTERRRAEIEAHAAKVRRRAAAKAARRDARAERRADAS